MEPTSTASRDDIGGKLILDRRDLIFELQLLLFEPFNLQLISGSSSLQRDDLAVEVAMLSPELHEKLTQFAFIRSLHPPMLNP